jgi:hydrogenase maturation protease
VTLLVIGYGNAGRGDDGLGPAFAERIAALRPVGCRIDIDYQLTVEHALQVAEAEIVVFVDAMIDGDAPYRFSRVSADSAADLTSHSLQPEAVLTLADLLYDTAPEAFVLGIRGESFGAVAEGLSAAASANLDLAEAFFLDWLAARRSVGAATPRARHA